MRRLALVPVLLLASCSGSGFWRYERDTFTQPGLPFIKGANPNQPVSSAENYRLSVGAKTSAEAPQLTEAGDIWPGPPAPVPTLKDLQKQQMSEINNTGSGAGLSPLPPLPSLPGYEISEQDPGHAAPPSALNVPGRRGTAILPVPQLPAGTDTTGNQPIIVPNGNGTSTVISPNGTVSTITTPK